jgi:hypothetical protein
LLRSQKIDDNALSSVAIAQTELIVDNALSSVAIR